VRFDSLPFGVFLPCVLLAYWGLHRSGHRYQNAVVLVASCTFYGWVDCRFLALLLGGALCDYLVGLGMARTVRPELRRALVGCSLLVNLGSLLVFKYLNFFISSLGALLDGVGLDGNLGVLSILVPIGISFFTLQRMTYVLDVHQGKLQATTDFLSFAAFACFFPFLLSGPIERASRMLPQFQTDRVFDVERASGALRLMLWGLFKKAVVADNLAGRVDYVFSHHDSLAGIDLAAGAFLFSVQLYADFSGYSDIAIGTSRLMGFRPSKNFAYPYFSRDIAEFWRRWHISLSSWFRDYIYTPLSWKLTLRARARKMGCILLTFSLSGLWHGAAWTFVVWGMLHALGFVPVVFRSQTVDESRQVAAGRWLPSARECAHVAATFGFVTLFWIFFRSGSLSLAVAFVKNMATHTWLVVPGSRALLLLACAFLALEWVRREREFPLDVRSLAARWRWVVYVGVSLGIMFWGYAGKLDFIYTRF